MTKSMFRIFILMWLGVVALIPAAVLTITDNIGESNRLVVGALILAGMFLLISAASYGFANARRGGDA